MNTRIRTAKRARNTYHDHLRRVPMFERLADADLDLVASTVSDLRLAAGRTLVRQGQAAREMMIVVAGEVEVERDGDRIATLGPGAVVGEMALLCRTRRNSTVTATTDVELLHLDAASFARLLDEVPGIAAAILPELAARAA